MGARFESERLNEAVSYTEYRRRQQPTSRLKARKWQATYLPRLDLLAAPDPADKRTAHAPLSSDGALKRTAQHHLPRQRRAAPAQSDVQRSRGRARNRRPTPASCDDDDAAPREKDAHDRAVVPGRDRARGAGAGVVNFDRTHTNAHTRANSE